MSAPGSVSVVIPTVGRVATLRRLIPALLDDPATGEIVIAADRCTIDVDVLTGGRGGAPVRVVPVDAGSAAVARNAGVASASCEVVLLLDDDVIPRPDLVSGHAARHAELNGSTVVVGLLDTDVPPLGDPSHVPASMYAESYDEHRRSYERDPGAILERLWGGNYSLTRSLAMKVGLHDPDFPAVDHNDRDFGLRLRRAGADAVFDPSLAVQHRYVRPPKWVWGDARRQGHGRVELARRHGPGVLDQVEPYDRHVAVQVLARLVATESGDRQAKRILGLATRVARRTHAWRLERWIVHRMRTAEVIAGVREASARR